MAARCWSSSASPAGADDRAPATCPMATSAGWSWCGRSPPRPRLLMLDEPAAGMDAAETRALLNLIDEIRHRYRPRGHRRRARHGPDHEPLRAHPGAGPWRGDLRGHAGRGAGQSRACGRSILAMPEAAALRRPSPPRREPLLSVEELRVDYGAVTACAA